MAVFNSLTFDGQNSLDYGIYITGEAVYDAPEREVEMINVPGRNGALAIDQGRFQNISVEYKAGTFGADHSEYASKMRDFRNVLASRFNYKRITDSYHPDEFRLGLFRSGLEATPTHYSSAGEFNVTFDCKPQRYLLSGTEEVEFTADGSITNPTLFASNPVLIVEGNGTVQIGDYIVAISGNTTDLWIDSELFEYFIPGANPEPLTDEFLDNITDEMGFNIEVVKGSIVPRPSGATVNFANHEYPKIAPGANAVYIDGITSLTIIPRWWMI